jgi:hypothetical protein
MFGGEAVRSLIEDLGRLQKTQFDDAEITSYDERYQTYLVMAILLAFSSSFWESAEERGACGAAASSGEIMIKWLILFFPLIAAATGLDAISPNNREPRRSRKQQLQGLSEPCGSGSGGFL